MSQYGRSSGTQRLAPTDQFRHSRDEPAPVGRAWTITSDDTEFRSSSQAHPRPAAPSQSQHTRPSHRTQRDEYEYTGEPLVRIRSPPPGSRNPADGAPTFKQWLSSDSGGPRLSPEEATHVISQMTYDELLNNQRQAAYEASVAKQRPGQTVYSGSIYSSESPSAGLRGFPSWMAPSTSSARSRTLNQGGDATDSKDVENPYNQSSPYASSKRRRRDDGESRRQ